MTRSTLTGPRAPFWMLVSDSKMSQDRSFATRLRIIISKNAETAILRANYQFWPGQLWQGRFQQGREYITANTDFRFRKGQDHQFPRKTEAFNFQRGRDSHFKTQSPILRKQAVPTSPRPPIQILISHSKKVKTFHFQQGIATQQIPKRPRSPCWKPTLDSEKAKTLNFFQGRGF